MTSAIDPVELTRLANLFCFKHCVTAKCLDCRVKDFVQFVSIKSQYPAHDRISMSLRSDTEMLQQERQ